MAGQTIGKVVAGGKTHTITSTFYGTCTTAAATAAKEVIINETNTTEALSFIPGMTLTVKFIQSNMAANPTLTCFNNSGSSTAPTKGSTKLLAAKPIYRLNPNLNSAGTAAGTNVALSWTSGAIVTFVYDGVGWVEISSTYNQDTDTHIYTSVYCSTGAATAAKVGTLSCSSWANTTQPRLAMINFYYSNTAASALTLNVASHGAKPIYINGQPSSSTNYTLPHGTYLGYFDGTNWFINTDGTIPLQTIDEVLVATVSTTATTNTKIWIEI